MSNATAGSVAGPFRTPSVLWALFGVTILVAGIVFRDALRAMADTWFSLPEYSHGVLIPIIAAFLVWQKQDELAKAEYRGSWIGVALVAVGALLHALGHIATLYIVQQYAMLLVLYGVVLSTVGWQAFRILWMPLLLLVFMIPLPQFLLQSFSAQLQLISSQIGVGVIRLFGISVHLEGNVIDLGQYRLQVAEACDGLRYLFPLMTLGFMMAYFYKAVFWKRALVFLSSIPITILMNSFRIGAIGVTVEHWGVRMAEGFLHEFQGWAVFMASTAIMLLLMMLLSRVGPDRGPWRDRFAIQFPRRTVDGDRRQTVARGMPVSLMAASALIAAYAGALALLPERTETVPLRPSFTTFPDRFGPWVGRSGSLESVYLDALKMSDYYLGDFAREGASPVNLYVAWYDSQRSGQSAHSPRSCLPGGGWRINALTQISLAEVEGPHGPVAVNRAVISIGNDRQLVYYWFQQRGRVITNEYLVKWYLFWDALTRNRTDGALVRLTTPLAPGEDPGDGDERLAEFASQAVPRLSAFVPD